MYKTLRLVICAAVLCLAQASYAQNLSNTPYSRYGLGEINQNLGNVRNAGMANTGISAGNSYQVNTINPALLYYNSITSFDIGVNGQLKKLENKDRSQVDGNANLSSLTLALPLSKRWSSAVSLRPYSSVNYSIRSTKPISSGSEATVTESYEGEGGISEVNFGHGIRITKGLTVGASVSYLFGGITRESASVINDPEIASLGSEGVFYSEKTNYSGLLFRAGTNYRQELKPKLFVSAGAVYSLNADLNAERNTTYQRRSLSGGTLQDSLMPASITGKVAVPSNFSAGLSIDNGSNLTVAADFSMHKWSDFRDIEGQQVLNDSYRVGLGAEYLPNASSVSNYLKRVTYRSGLYYGVTPYKINGEQIKDMGLTVGATFPFGVSTIYDLYQLNTALGFGQRGTTDNGLISEKYFQFSIGVIINSRWFIKRRIE